MPHSPHPPIPDRVRAGASHLALIALLAALPAALAPALATSQPTPTASSNPSDGQALVAAIHDRLARDTHIDVHTQLPDLRVTARSTEGVTLSGTPATLLARERALHIARAEAGAATVVDALAPIPSTRSDDEIEADVRDVLDAEPLLADATVYVRGGEVHLSGEIASRQLVQLAVSMTSGVAGVTCVHDVFEIVEPERRTDADIDRELEATLDWDAAIDARHVEVDVSGGRVTLHGHIGSAAEKNRAVVNAWTAGVVSVQASALYVDASAVLGAATQLNPTRPLWPR